MSKSKTNWKNALLKKGIPLEHEVSKILVDEGFQIETDYPYPRITREGVKDFSLDIISSKFYHGNGHYFLPIECKYSSPNYKWCFIEHPKKKYLPTSVVKQIDLISCGRLEKKLFWTKGLPIYYKNFIIKDGEIDKKTIIEGLMQLKYSLPQLITNNLSSASSLLPLGILPFFFCPILITNSELLTLNSEVSMNDIRHNDNIEDIAIKKKYLIYKLPSYSDFQQHKNHIFMSNRNIIQNKHFQTLGKVIKKSKYPLSLLSEYNILTGKDSVEPFYNTILICNIGYLTQLTKRIHKSIIKSMKNFSVFETWSEYFGKDLGSNYPNKFYY